MGSQSLSKGASLEPLTWGFLDPTPAFLQTKGNILKISLARANLDGARVPGGGAGTEARWLLRLVSPGNSPACQISP